LKLVTFAKALKKAVAANAKLLASLLVKQAAVSQTKNAKTQKKANSCISSECRRSRRHFLVKGVKINGSSV
jgi:hypothetical protein